MYAEMVDNARCLVCDEIVGAGPTFTILTFDHQEDEEGAVSVGLKPEFGMPVGICPRCAVDLYHQAILRYQDAHAMDH